MKLKGNVLILPHHIAPSPLFFLQDCIMMPMCACSVCDGCARAALTEAENNSNACPACGEQDNSPEDLIPCRKVREKVNEFKAKNSGAAAKVIKKDIIVFRVSHLVCDLS